MKKLFFQILWQLIYKELKVFLSLSVSKAIDLLIIVSSNLLVFVYLMPYFGLKTSYGALILVGLCSILGFFEAIPRTSDFVTDLTGSKKISYLLTLPLPTFMTLLSIPLSWGLCSAIYTIWIIPLGKLILESKFTFAEFSVWRFLLSFLSTHLMFGCFAFFLAGLIKNMKYMSWIWARVVNPFFMFGGYFYTWKSLYNMVPTLSYINFFNPVLLSIESLRSAALGPENYLPFWLTTSSMWVFACLFAVLGIYTIKKRLDCV